MFDDSKKFLIINCVIYKFVFLLMSYALFLFFSKILKMCEWYTVGYVNIKAKMLIILCWLNLGIDAQDMYMHE